MDTEDIDDPFHEAKVGDKVIVGGRAMKLFSDSADVLQRLNEPLAKTDPENPTVPAGRSQAAKEGSGAGGTV
jgi:hypothetical protein